MMPKYVEKSRRPDKKKPSKLEVSRKISDDRWVAAPEKSVLPESTAQLHNIIGNRGTLRVVAAHVQRDPHDTRSRREREENETPNKAAVKIAYQSGRPSANGDGLSVALTIGNLVLNIVDEVAGSFAFSAVAVIAGTVISAVDLLGTIKEANERQLYSGKVLGTKLGLRVLGLFSSSDDIPIKMTRSYLEAQVQSRTDLFREWETQILYAGISGPNLVIGAMRQGLDSVATNTTTAFRQVDKEVIRRLQQDSHSAEAQRQYEKNIREYRVRVCHKIFELGYRELQNSFEVTEKKYLSRLDTTEKIRMIQSLLNGWVTDKDLDVIRRISHSNPVDLPAIRAAIAPRATELTSFRQRWKLRQILGGI